MKASPAQLSTRYLPFLVVAAVLCLLVVLTPSKGPGTGSLAAGGGNFSGEGVSEGSSGDFEGADGGAALDGGALDGTAGGVGGTSATGSGGSLGAGDGPVGGGGAATGGAALGDAEGGPATGTGGGTGTGAGGATATSSGDLSNCEPNGRQKEPVYSLGVTCRAKFAGDNGGATMPGVTATEIRYTWYNPPENAVVNGLLAGAGFAREPEPFCDAMIAFEKSLQQQFEMSGRKLVAVDGPGGQAGSSRCGGRYKFFQSQCSSDRADPPCYRSDAQVIAQQLKPAFVIAPRGSSVLMEELATNQVFAIGYSGSRERFQQYAPYLWGQGLSIERLFSLHAEYYCKRLVGEEPVYGGDDVKAFPGTRHVGMIYPDNGDGVLQPAIDIWIETVRACGDPNAKLFTYQSDVTRAQQQASSIVAQMRADNITTIAACCDPVSNVFFLQALEQNRYFPEHFVLPASSIASDAAGNAYEDLGLGGQWAHAFGISNYAVNQDDRELDYRKAYADGGGSGGAQAVPMIEIESFGSFHVMMQMIHSAGPRPTPQSIFEGMQNLPTVAPSKFTAGFDYAPPDPFKPQLDVSEIWWNPDLYSYYSDTNGAMCHVSDGARYALGLVPQSRPNLFSGGNGACARLKPGT